MTPGVPARRCARRRGVVLLAAVCTMMLVALLVAGGMASVNLAQSSSRTERTGTLLTSSAQAALTDVLCNWPNAGASPSSLDSLAPGSTATLRLNDSVSGTTARVSITALPHGVYWLVADANSLPDSGIHVLLNVVAASPATRDSLGGGHAAAAPPRPVSSRAWAELFQGT